MEISNIRNLVMQCAFLSNFHWLLLGVSWVPEAFHALFPVPVKS